MTGPAKRLGTDVESITQAAAVLKAGGLVSFPTETVYGLGADACNGRAVASIYAAKGRPSFNPLIVHLANIEMALSFARFDATSRKLAEAFWPGPLSLVVPVNPDAGLSELVTAGLPTVALRVPQHALAHQLLIAFGGPVAAPSANPSGQISPTTADHVLEGLGDWIDAVLDGGPCSVGVESTIVQCDRDTVAILRDGGITREEIEAELGWPVIQAGDNQTPQSPGQLASHYAPSVAVRLNADTATEQEVYLGFGPDARNADLNLSRSGNLIEAAANLFANLHQADAMAQSRGANTIAVSPIPLSGLGLAINDRLSRAAAPRG
jgi:L-threonylcarbamoyladenylate synthase